jgi:hypothetical protein
MTTLLKTVAIVSTSIVPNQFPQVLKSDLPFSLLSLAQPIREIGNQTYAVEMLLLINN